MKKLVLVALAAMIALTPALGVAQAKNAPSSTARPEQNQGQQIKKSQPVKKWKKGGKYQGGGKNVSNYRAHNLKAPPHGHRWVRDGDNFLLVAIGTGIIASIVAGR